MSDLRPDPSTFRTRLLAREPMIGTFMKVPASQNTEILGLEGFDFVVLDEEHAPWTRGTLDAALLAARAYGTAGIVRIARPDANSILSVLDDGAIGIMVPHVDTAQKVRDVVSWARYLGGTRGSGASRGGEYGKRGGDNYRISDAITTVICMIEDRHALDEIDEIAAVEGVDALFLGRADLALSLRNAEGSAPGIQEAVERIVEAANRAGKPVAAVVQSMQSDETTWLRGLGITALMVASDIGLLRQAASSALREFNALMRPGE
ncbi:HpcH/HpaI aldolase family protein [Sphingomonas soli]|uniref:HpcH/HpaI aldolase family protein n=1 Tax=Sphingomonas soli TaxID=266127 RepID=UPI0008307453|nr:aldolase/citrate lyase family protein [Sphingomonas soli]